VNGYLLDTNVLSEFSRSTIPPHSRVQQWVESIHPDMMFTSVLTFGEIRKGIDLLPQGRKRTELEQWLDSDLNGWFEQNLLPVTKAISKRWGRLAALAQQRGTPLGNIDGLLAATAIEHDLVLVTRNTRHFADLGVAIFSPWES
jgi:predicted nucleic acid-binding protein